MTELTSRNDGRVVAVTPSIAYACRPRLFGALETAFPVTFVPVDGAATRHVDGVVTFGTNDDFTGVTVPRLELMSGDGASRPGIVSFAEVSAVPASFRGRRFRDEHLTGGRSVPVGAGDEVLALVDDRPIWARTCTGARRVSTAPPELRDGSPLRELLRAGRFMSLLPLVDFVRELTMIDGWTPPPLQACFVFDDPNLHRSRYGFIDYEELARTAVRHDFHAAMAFIPFDAWFASGSAVSIFRRHPNRLSLLVHGNDHVREELGREYAADDIDALLGMALRRISRLERRTGLRVARVMAPPHGQCSTASLEGLDRTGFDAICSTLAYGWGSSSPDLVGWEAGGFAVGCVGAVPRVPLKADRDDLSFRAYLDQPLVLYGHHDDLSDGVDILADVAADVHRLGTVSFCGLDGMVERRVETRVEGSLLRIRPLARRVRLDVPIEIDEIEVELHPSLDPERCRAIASLGRDGEPSTHAVDGPRVRFPASPGTSVQLRLLSRDARDVDSIPAPRRSLWPTGRRLLTYSRDQMLPLVRRRV